MSLYQSPKIVTDNLIFHYDMINGKSFAGGPVTNTLPNPVVNGLPTVGNGWGTYNTNQYNGNAYFSIGAIASVSGNVVTTTGNHPLRSYDVVTPQTTGGGVTAGTNYLVKKLSNTTFSLHPYNSSQDGSQGYINPATGNHKVYDDFSNNIRIAVNSTSFPTMWWGPPHLPNSALVKEIISNGFNGILGRMPTDCIRLHYNRTDATDGMSYGVDAAVVAGTPYTVSFWARSVTASAVGTTGSYQIYNYGATTPTGYSTGFTLGPVGVWQKYTLTFTPNNPLAISYWFPGAGGIKYDISNIQFEAGSIANNFVTGTRSNTETIFDLTGNNFVTATSLTYASNGTFSFNGSNRMNFTMSGSASQLTYTRIVWIKPTASSGDMKSVMLNNIGNNSDMAVGIANGYAAFHQYVNSNGPGTSGDLTISGVTPVPLNQNCMIAITVDRSITTNNVKVYLNGALDATASRNLGTSNSDSVILGGPASDSYAGLRMFYGTVYSASHYNRALTATEVQQNFNALRGRYGL